jgi:hypothetical protein
VEPIKDSDKWKIYPTKDDPYFEVCTKNNLKKFFIFPDEWEKGFVRGHKKIYKVEFASRNPIYVYKGEMEGLCAYKNNWDAIKFDSVFSEDEIKNLN